MLGGFHVKLFPFDLSMEFKCYLRQMPANIDKNKYENFYIAYDNMCREPRQICIKWQRPVSYMFCQCIVCTSLPNELSHSNFLQLPSISSTLFHFISSYEAHCQAESGPFIWFLNHFYLSIRKNRCHSKVRHNTSNIVYQISSLDFRFQKQLLPARLDIRRKLPSCRNNQRLCLLQIPPAQQLSPALLTDRVVSTFSALALACQIFDWHAVKIRR